MFKKGTNLNMKIKIKKIPVKQIKQAKTSLPSRT